MSEPVSRSQDVKIPLDEPADGVTSVDGILGVPEWWPTGARIGVVLAHGSGRNLDDPLVAALQRGLTERKYLALRFNFPFAQSGRTRPDALPVLERVFRHAVNVLARDPSAAPAHLFIGGVGLGAQVAVQLAASRLRVDGVFALGLPLHSRDHPEKNLHADALFRVVSPLLFVQGTRDRNCDLDALRRTLTRVGAPKTLHVIEEGDGALVVPRRSGRAPESVQAEVLEAVDVWCHRVIGA
jgi:predicted alpha/beta-hydrolase family hydrolase